MQEWHAFSGSQAGVQCPTLHAGDCGCIRRFEIRRALWYAAAHELVEVSCLTLDLKVWSATWFSFPSGEQR